MEGCFYLKSLSGAQIPGSPGGRRRRAAAPELLRPCCSWKGSRSPSACWTTCRPRCPWKEARPPPRGSALHHLPNTRMKMKKTKMKASPLLLVWLSGTTVEAALSGLFTCDCDGMFLKKDKEKKIISQPKCIENYTYIYIYIYVYIIFKQIYAYVV